MRRSPGNGRNYQKSETSEQHNAREIARTLGVARSTIQDNLARAQAAGIGWPLPAE
jgi:IS30 family transposase